MQPDVFDFQKMSALDCSWHVPKFQASVLIKSFLHKKECKSKCKLPPQDVRYIKKIKYVTYPGTGMVSDLNKLKRRTYYNCWKIHSSISTTGICCNRFT